MITCYVRYTMDADQRGAFESYARAWMPLVDSLGGTHHGYFLPDGAGEDVAVALFSFPDRAAYETYKRRRDADPRCRAAYAIAKASNCILHYEARFMHPVLPEAS